MKKGVFGFAVAAFAALLMLGVGCDSGAKTNKTGEPTKSSVDAGKTDGGAGKTAGTSEDQPKGPEVIQVSGIPDSSSANLDERYATVMDYLAKETGLKFKYMKVGSYNDAQSAFLSGKAHVVFFGGVTGVLTLDHADAKGAEILATRDIDLKFQSFVIANKKHIGTDKGQIAAGRDWNTEALKVFYKGKQFTFGDPKSTSGHVMPHYLMQQAGIDPDTLCDKVSYQADHNATIKAVADGTCDVGVCNFTNYNKADDATKANAQVIAVTPEYPDYMWVGSAKIPAADREKIRAALLKLDPTNPDHRKIMDVLGDPKQQKFVAAPSSTWDPIRKVLREMNNEKKKNG